MESDVRDIGSGLREARERLGLSLKQAESETRIRARYLAALEEERFGELPGEAYVRGFLRSYASFLGLDGAQYLAAYRARVRAAEPAIAPVGIVGAADRRWGAGAAVAVAAAALAALGLAAWKLDDRSRPAATEAPPAGTTTAPAAPTTTTPRPAPAAPAPLVLRAVRGGTRLDVRVGGPAGKRAWRGTLRPGRTVRLGLGRALFIRASAPRNLRATIGGRRQPIPPRANELVATRDGVRPRP